MMFLFFKKKVLCPGDHLGNSGSMTCVVISQDMGSGMYNMHFNMFQHFYIVEIIDYEQISKLKAENLDLTCGW